MSDSPSTAMGWIRSNLALAGFVFALLSATTGGLISGTLRVARYDSRLDALEANQAELAKSDSKLADAQTARQVFTENDKRDRDERRVALANDLSVIRSRLAVLEQTSLQINALQNRLNEMDQRGTGGMGDMRRDIQAQLAQLDRRTALLESQGNFIANYIHDNFLLPPSRPAGVRR